VHVVAFVASALLIAVVLWDAFETVILPRTVTRKWRVARTYFRTTWRGWRRVGLTYQSDGRRERFLAIYGPLSLLGLAAFWALGLVVGFAGVHWGVGSHLQPLSSGSHFVDDLYMSGTTFFTLGLGDLQPVGTVARIVTVAEAGTGFAFLASVITYLPVLYQSFSRREVRLTLLDAWAGSPPSAVEILRRLASAGQMPALDPFLKDWEYWCSEVMESHISYPTLAFFRSQHQRQSWVSALSTVLDLSSLIIVGIDGVSEWQARVTFAIARHAAVDLTQVLRAAPPGAFERLPATELEQLRLQLEEVGLKPARSADADRRLRELRASYEPYVLALATTLLMPASAWRRQPGAKDNWQTSPKGLAEAHL
jgi:hypothetical protein